MIHNFLYLCRGTIDTTSNYICQIVKSNTYFYLSVFSYSPNNLSRFFGISEKNHFNLTSKTIIIPNV